MSTEKINQKFDNLIKIYQGIIPNNIDTDPLKELVNFALENKNNYNNFSNIIINHLKNDEDAKIKSVLFNIIDSLFKKFEIGDYYVQLLSKHLYDNFKECFNIGDFDERVLLFKIFYTWKYIIPGDIYISIYNDLKLADFQEIFEKKFPGKLKKYDDYNKNIKNNKELNSKINNNNKINDKAQNEGNKIDANINNDTNDTKKHKKKKVKKFLNKKRESSRKESEKENESLPNKIKIEQNSGTIISQIPNQIQIPPLFNPSNVPLSEFKLYVSLIKFQKIITLNKTSNIFNSISKYYNDIIMLENNITPKKIKNYDEIRKKMKQKLFDETSKNKCFCGFKTLYYNNLIKHLDVHFNKNYLSLEGKNLFRKKGNNKAEWINGNYNNNNYDDTMIIDYTLNNLIYYKNMMNNNHIKINEKKEEDNEEYMYPINDNNLNEICRYCGDKFKKIFSSKYNYWFFNQVVLVNDEKNKYIAHRECYEELVKKIK